MVRAGSSYSGHQFLGLLLGNSFNERAERQGVLPVLPVFGDRDCNHWVRVGSQGRLDVVP